MTSRSVTLLVADGHNVVREGLVALLGREKRYSVLGEAGDGLKVVELVARLRPDVLIADLVLPGLGGVELARQLEHRVAGTRVIILSAHMSETHVLGALHNGARGYVSKYATSSDLFRAIDEVAAGHYFLSPPLTGELESYRERAAAGPVDSYERLTTRERQVLSLAAEGLGNTEMAGRLGISPRTAETHRARVMRKLGLRRLTDVFRYAVGRGLLAIESEAEGPQLAQRATENGSIRKSQ